MVRFFCKLFLLVLLSLAATFSAYCQNDDKSAVQVQEAKVVKIVQIRGNKNVSTSSIMAKLKTQPNKRYSQAIVDDDLKTLYTMGYFTDVSIDMEDYKDGVRVVFFVKEKPVIKSVAYQGNASLKQDNFKKVVKSKADGVLDYRQLKEDCEEIKKKYEQKGYTHVDVDYKLDIDKKTNLVDVIFIVNEGKKYAIRSITVEGNKTLKKDQIIKVMQTKANWFFKKGYLKEDVLEDDVERVRTFYENEGFMDAKVDKEVKYDTAKGFVDIIMKVQENTRYYTGSITLSGNNIFSEKELFTNIRIKSNDVFRPWVVKDDSAGIQAYYFDRGYIFAYVESETLLNSQTGKIDVSFGVKEGVVAYVDKIEVKGNTKTKDVVIRRELRLAPGERFDGQKLRRSKERLYNLGYFEDVSFDIVEGSSPTNRNLVVTVKETKTGEISFGGGFSSVDSLIGFVEINQKNFDLFNFPTFTGAGQILDVKAQLGSTKRDFSVSFTEPWFLGKPLAFGFDVFLQDREKSSRSGWAYDERDKGFDVKLGKELGEFLTGTLIYQLENVKIDNLPDNASQSLKDQIGTTTTSSLEGILKRDSRDSVYSPTKGNLTSLSLQGAGGPFFGDNNFVKLYGDTDWYFREFKKSVLEFRFRAGIVDSFGDSDTVPIYQRFFCGGADTVRGYREREVGPRDEGTNDPVGGKSVFIFNIEYTIPIVDFLKGAVFYDAGNVWSKVDEIFTDTLRQGAGVGIRVKTPVGPLKLDYGYPLNPAKGDKKVGRFHFNLTRGF